MAVTELTNLETTSVDLVDRGANKRRILVRKRAAGKRATKVAKQLPSRSTVHVPGATSDDDTDEVYKAVTPFADLPIAPLDTEWSFDATEADAVLGSADDPDWERYERAHLLIDRAAIDERGEPAREDFRLPFARMFDGTLKAVWNGIVAARGALAGARTPLQGVSSDEKATANSHLDRYTRKINEALPEGATPKPLSTEKQHHTGGTGMPDISKREVSPELAAAIEAFQAGNATDDQAAMVGQLAADVLSGEYPPPEREEEVVIEAQADAAEDEAADEANKAEDDAMAKRHTDQLAALEKRHSDQIEAIQKRLDDETDRRLVAQHVTLAKQWGHLGAADKTGPVLKRIHGAITDDDWTWLQKQFSGVQAIAKRSKLFDEVGVNGDGADGGSPAAELETIAKRLHTGGKAESLAKAHVLAQQQRPDLVRELNQRDN